MATTSPTITFPNVKPEAETRATESSEQKKSTTLKDRILQASREMFAGHGENYFDGF
jgi:hypothetical protein